MKWNSVKSSCCDAIWWKCGSREKRKAHQDLNLWPPNCETIVQTFSLSLSLTLFSTEWHRNELHSIVGYVHHLCYLQEWGFNYQNKVLQKVGSREHFVSSCIKGMFSCHDQYILKMWHVVRKVSETLLMWSHCHLVFIAVTFDRPQVVPECYMPLCHHSMTLFTIKWSLCC